MPTPSDMLEPKIIVSLTKDQKQTFYKGLTYRINITNNREDNIFLMLLCIMQLGKTIIYKNYFPLNLKSSGILNIHTSSPENDKTVYHEIPF